MAGRLATAEDLFAAITMTVERIQEETGYRPDTAGELLLSFCLADSNTRAEARACVIDYIEMFYNSRRRHSYLDYVSPAEFEARANVA
jgi:transposase InsO family protein